MPDTSGKLPHWDLSNVYAGLEAADFTEDMAKLKGMIDDLGEFIKENGIGRLPEPPADTAATGKILDEAIERLNALIRLRATLNAFINSFSSTDTRNAIAARKMSELEQLGVRLENAYTRFEAWVGSLGPVLERICAQAPIAREHHQALLDIVEESKHRMDAKLEDLATELVLAGGGSMWKLQYGTTSQLTMPFERDGKTEDLPMTVLRNLGNDPDEDVRRRGYETEIAGWEKIREPVAFAMNGVKGTAVTLAKWRGYDSVLHTALELNKIDRPTLDALLAAMKGSFPMFRRYFKSKAKKLGKKQMAWWDLSAPMGEADLHYTWSEASDFVVEQFGQFSGELAEFARNAFDRNWIDAEPREGKIGGAFCMRVPGVDESRVLANFDGSFDAVATVSHELGHGFHNYCQVGLPMLRQGSPMTLAETASIMCETIVSNAALAGAPADAKLSILENQLINASQVIVDIYSRFIFESEVIERRAESELSADDFCEIMLDAQRQTYGDGLDPKHLHPYMWLLKPHYYSHGYNFYNFPYAFGLLFGLGVYAIYLEEGESFLPRYKELLRSTGEGKAADLASRYGIDITSRDFWDASIQVIAKQVDEYCEL